ncbi:hypothetical protein [Aeromonas enterica]
MKLATRLTIADTPCALVEHDVALDLSAGGRAVLVIQGAAAKGDTFALDVGYNNDLRRWFTGYVETVQPTDNGSSRLLCRELAGALAAPLPVSQQHTTLRGMLAWLTEQTGLTFLLPQGADYTDTPIPNFTSAGTGYQLLNNAGRAFSVPDFIWYQQPDGTIFVGSHAHSRWAGKNVTMDPAWARAQAGNQFTMPPSPVLRPGATVDGKRVIRVRLTGEDMTITTATPGKVAKSAQQRQTEQQFPELAAGTHLPQFGIVVSISDRASAGQTADPFRPRYAVDVQVLGEDGKPDSKTPLYRAVPLPVLFGGQEQGLLQYPLEGTVVELGFAFGRVDRPFVRTILGQGWPLPDITPGEQLQQQRAEVAQRIDAVGNRTAITDRTHTDSAWQLRQQADDDLGEFGQHQISTQQHSVELIGAMKRIEALGGIELLAGDAFTLGSLGNMSQTTAGSLTEVVGELRRAIAGTSQHLEAPQSWMGTDSTNIFQLLLQLMNLVEQLATTTATHTHPSVGTPNEAGELQAHAQTANALANTLNPIIE